MKTETHKLKQLNRSAQADFLPVERQLAKHTNILNIVETQLNRLIRELNLFEDSVW